MTSKVIRALSILRFSRFWELSFLRRAPARTHHRQRRGACW